MMLDDLARPSVADLARALDLSRSTVDRYTSADDAPRPVMLALFWLTRWGQSAVDCQAVNTAAMHYGRAAALADDLARAERRLAHLAQIGDFGAANDPALILARPGFAPLRSDPRAQPGKLADDGRSHDGASDDNGRFRRDLAQAG